MRFLTLLVLSAACLNAQRWEVNLVGSYPRFNKAKLGSISETPKDDDSSLKGLRGYGLRLTWNTAGYYGHEIGYVLMDATFRTTVRTASGNTTVTETFSDKVKVQEGFYNLLLYMMPAGERFRPFLTGGGHMTRFGRPDVPNFPGASSRTFGANFGGGLKIRLAKPVQFRLDVREYIGGKPYDLTFEDVTKSGGLLRHLELSAGIGIAF